MNKARPKEINSKRQARVKEGMKNQPATFKQFSAPGVLSKQYEASSTSCLQKIGLHSGCLVAVSLSPKLIPAIITQKMADVVNAKRVKQLNLFGSTKICQQLFGSWPRGDHYRLFFMRQIGINFFSNEWHKGMEQFKASFVDVH